jgi:signal-transduction protein with cAMP-binding, CBS, and nucleotidyltransferase domain
MRNTLKAGFDPKKARIEDYMSKRLRGVPFYENVYDLMEKFISLRLRHLVIEKDGSYIGLLSIGDVIKAACQGPGGWIAGQ